MLRFESLITQQRLAQGQGQSYDESNICNNSSENPPQDCDISDTSLKLG